MTEEENQRQMNSRPQFVMPEYTRTSQNRSRSRANHQNTINASYLRYKADLLNWFKQTWGDNTSAAQSSWFNDARSIAEKTRPAPTPSLLGEPAPMADKAAQIAGQRSQQNQQSTTGQRRRKSLLSQTPDEVLPQNAAAGKTLLGV